MNRPSLAALVLIALIGSLSPLLRAQTPDVAVIVNPSNPVTNLSLAELRKVLSGERHTWPGGAPVKLIASAPGTHERLVMLKIVGMSENEYKQYWMTQVFRGEANREPVSLPSFGMTLEATRAFPGAIALVDARYVKNTMATKVVRIDGRSPGDPGYPLH